MSTAQTESLDLSAFCDPPDDPNPRYSMTAPWTKYGKVYATQGHTLIECEQIAVSPQPATEGTWPKVDEILEGFPDVCSDLLPNLKKPLDELDQWWRHDWKCDLCYGFGLHECNCEYCSREVECSDCGGVGSYLQTHPDAYKRISIEGLNFACRHLWAIAQLPSVKVRAVGKMIGGEVAPYLYFTFDGGRGVHIGLRRG